MGFFFLAILTQGFGQPATIEIEVLGIAQDAGFPQINCQKSCCKEAWRDVSIRKSPVCLAIYDHSNGHCWMVEATPDFKSQWQRMTRQSIVQPKGILITHAHIGHYTGLMQLGKEAMNATGIPVYILPRMADFLSMNGPWSQLVNTGNIKLQPIIADTYYNLNPNIRFKSFTVPHRDEYSETAGFILEGPTKKLLFIPDIDKWSNWDQDMRILIQSVDFALIDGTFFQDGELENRDMASIPHPFITESIDLFKTMDKNERQKIFFIHFNHTNPLVKGDKHAIGLVHSYDMQVAKEGMKFSL